MVRPDPEPAATAPAALLLAVALLVALAGLVASCLISCGPLSPGAKLGIEAAVAAACPLEAAIPVVGAFAASACPGEEAAVAAALAGTPEPGTSVVAEPSDAGPPVAAVYRRTARGLVCIGHGRHRHPADAGAPDAAPSDAGAPAYMAPEHADAGR